MFEFILDNSSYFDFTTKDKMDFVIKQNSELPILELIPIKTKNYNELLDIIKNSSVSFSMFDANNCYVILNDAVTINLDTSNNNYNLQDDTCRELSDFTLQYKFKKKNTFKAGFYSGEFKITFTQDNEEKILIVPINNKLNIIITPSNTK
jgi:hypothetical protein